MSIYHTWQEALYEVDAFERGLSTESAAQAKVDLLASLLYGASQQFVVPDEVRDYAVELAALVYRLAVRRSAAV